MGIRFRPTPSPTGTANRVAIYDPVSGVLTESTATDTELQLLVGLTGDILTTTNAKTVSSKTFAQDIVFDANNTRDIASNAVKAKDAYLQGQLNAGTVVTTGNVTVGGDLTVQGSTITANVATIEVEDPNILLNNGGNDATSEGAGLTIERTGTSGSLIYADASATKFRAGPLGTEVDLVGTSSSQTLSNKTIVAANNTITTAAAGNLAATELNAALAELDGDITTVSNSLAAKWSKAGDSGTTAGTNFIGTTDAQDVVIKRNSTEIARAQADGWQAATLVGSSSSGGNVTLRSTSNATPGDIKIGDRDTEQTIIGSTGSATTPLYPVAVLTPTTQSLTNSFVIHENSADMPNGRNVAGPQGWQFVTKDIDGAVRMFTRVNGFDIGEWSIYRASDGTLLGQMDFGAGWGIRSTRESVAALRVSGFGVFTANIQEWYSSTAYSNLVASVGPGGQFRAPAGVVGTPGFAFQGDTNNGWWAPAADTQAWSLAGSEAMRLDSTGLGIGASATAKLQVTNTAAATVATIVKGATSQSADLQQWQNSAGSTLAKIDSAGNAITAALTTSGTNTFSALSTGVAHLNASGVMSSSNIVNADVDAAAAIARSKLASGTASHVLINDGSGVMSSEAQLAISRGGTGQSTATAAFDALAPTTTKGDIIVHNGTDNIRVPVGTNNFVLTADSAEASGVKWAAAGSGVGSWADSGFTSSNFGGMGTVSGIKIRYLMLGATTMMIQGSFTIGTPAGATASIDIPNSKTAASHYASTAPFDEVGRGTTNTTTSYQFQLMAAQSDTKLYIGITNSTGLAASNKRNGTDLFGTGQVFTFNCVVEVV